MSSGGGPGHSYQFDGDVPTFDDSHAYDDGRIDDDEGGVGDERDEGFDVDGGDGIGGRRGSGGSGRARTEMEPIHEGPGPSGWDFVRRRVKSEVEDTDDLEANQQKKWEELRADIREVTHQGKHFSFVGIVQAEKRRVNFSKAIQRFIRKIAVAEDVSFVGMYFPPHFISKWDSVDI
jgi:hypothetical protein